MLNHTLDQIASLKFHGLKAALLEQLEQPGAYSEMSFEERISHLIDREVLDRRNRRTQRMLGISKLKHKSVFPEDVDYQAARNLERAVLQNWPELLEVLIGQRVQASRRALRLFPAELEWGFEGSDMELNFVLPPGAYATTVLREIMLSREA